MYIIYTMAVSATLVLLHTHSCSAPTLLPLVQHRRPDASSPAQKYRFLPQQKWVVVDAGFWQTLHQLKPQQRTRMFPKKNIRKKPIIPTDTVKRAAVICPRAIASDDEPSSALSPLSLPHHHNQDPLGRRGFRHISTKILPLAPPSCPQQLVQCFQWQGVIRRRSLPWRGRGSYTGGAMLLHATYCVACVVRENQLQRGGRGGGQPSVRKDVPQCRDGGRRRDEVR